MENKGYLKEKGDREGREVKDEKVKNGLTSNVLHYSKDLALIANYTTMFCSFI